MTRLARVALGALLLGSSSLVPAEVVHGAVLPTATTPGAGWVEPSPGAPNPEGGSLAYDSVRHVLVDFDSGGVTWIGDGTTWVRRAPAAHPPARRFATMAFDGRAVVLFGGQDSAAPPGSLLDDTWTWDGSSWTQQAAAPAAHPPARFDASMAREGATSSVVLFGGVDPGSTICSLESAAGAVGVGVMGIGIGVGGGCAFDPSTWVWDGRAGTWTSFQSPGPPPRYGASMAFDRASGRVLLFGGSDTLAEAGTGGTGGLDDTWSWDGGAERWIREATSPAASLTAPVAPGAPVAAVPPSRAWASMATDSRGAVLFGGKYVPTEAATQAGVAGTSRFVGDTWQWDGRGWSQLAPASSPSARARAAMASTEGGAAVLYGGTTYGITTSFEVSVPASDASWGWSSSSWSPIGGAPLARDLAAAAYDAGTGETLLLGGRGPAQVPLPNSGSTLTASLDDTWTWDGSGWTARTSGTSPGPGVMAYDAARHQVVLQAASDTWTWDSVRRVWVRQSPLDLPPANSGGAMAFDAARQQVVLVVPFSPSGSGLADTWTWDGSNWTQRTPAVSPPERAGGSLAYDQVRQRVVLFGGVDRDGLALGDTWIWDGATWTPGPAAGPSRRGYAAMTFDDAAGVTVLAGGAGCPPGPVCYIGGGGDPMSGSVPLGDVWTWDGTAWSPLTTVNVPPSRAGAVMTYDQARRSLVLIGGNRNPAGVDIGGPILHQPDDFIDDVWTLDPTVVAPAQAAVAGPSSLGFGGSAVGVPAGPRTVVLSNRGTSAMTIAAGGIRTGLTDYATGTDCPASLAPWSSCTISVVLTPAALGSRPATLSVADSAPGSPQNVSLSGAGLPLLGGDASAVRVEGVTLLGGVAAQRLPDGGQGVCEAGPLRVTEALTAGGSGLPGCQAAAGGPATISLPVAGPVTAPSLFTAAGPTETVSTGGGAGVARSTLASASVLPGRGPGGVDVLDVTGLDAQTAASCSGSVRGAPTGFSSIAGLSIGGTRVATQPVGSRIIFNPTGKNPITLYGNPITVNPTGARVPMAIVTLNYSRYDPATNTQVSSPLEVEFPPGGALSSIIVGRVFISYASNGALGCR